MKTYCKTAAAVALFGAAVGVHGAGLVNGIEAVVHDAVITHQDVDEETGKAVRELWRDYRDQPDVFRRKVDEAARGNLELLTERQLILHEFNTAGYNLPEKVIDDEVEREVRSHGDRPTYIQTLKAQGMTLERHRQQMREHIIEVAMREKNVSSEVIISPHKVEVYYEEHRESFKLPDRVKLRLIVLNQSNDPNAPRARKLAEEILSKINAGAAFAEMATLYSEDRVHQKGGDRGWVQKGELRMELDTAAFSLKKGQHTGVIETPGACYLLEVGDLEPAHYSPLGEVRGQIEKDLQDRERTRLQHQWLEKLRKKTFVAYYH